MKPMSIFKAIKTSNVNELKKLINSGADLYKKNYEGYSPLHYAAMWYKFDCVKTFLDAGVYVDLETNDEETPLMLATCDYRINRAGYKHIETFKVLLNAGANVNIQQKWLHSPLSHASECDSAILKLIISKDAQLELQDELGRTPLHLAVRYGKLENVKMLIQAGSDLNALDLKGKMPEETGDKEEVKGYVRTIREQSELGEYANVVVVERPVGRRMMARM